MAGKYSSSSFSVFLVAGYTMLAAKVKNVTLQIMSRNEPTHGLGDGWEASLPTGMQAGVLTQDGAFFDDTTGGQHDAFAAAQGVTRVACAAMAGDTIGQAAFGFQGAYNQAYEVLATIGMLTKAAVLYAISGNADWGLISQNTATKTTNWTSTSVDNGASSANGAASYVQVTAFSGFTNVVLKLQHSTDNVSFTDLITHTTVTAAPTAERSTVAGTVNRYTRLSGTVTGSGSITVFAMAARLA